MDDPDDEEEVDIGVGGLKEPPSCECSCLSLSFVRESPVRCPAAGRVESGDAQLNPPSPLATPPRKTASYHLALLPPGLPRLPIWTSSEFFSPTAFS